MNDSRDNRSAEHHYVANVSDRALQRMMDEAHDVQPTFWSRPPYPMCDPGSLKMLPQVMFVDCEEHKCIPDINNTWVGQLDRAMDSVGREINNVIHNLTDNHHR